MMTYPAAVLAAWRVLRCLQNCQPATTGAPPNSQIVLYKHRSQSKDRAANGSTGLGIEVIEYLLYDDYAEHTLLGHA